MEPVHFLCSIFCFSARARMNRSSNERRQQRVLVILYYLVRSTRTYFGMMPYMIHQTFLPIHCKGSTWVPAPMLRIGNIPRCHLFIIVFSFTSTTTTARAHNLILVPGIYSYAQNQVNAKTCCKKALLLTSITRL